MTIYHHSQSYVSYHVPQTLVIDEASKYVTCKRYSIDAAVELFPAIVLVA